MFDNSVVAAFANLIGWKQYRDTNVIDLPDTLTNSETSEYFQQKHAALRLDYIQTLLPSDYPLATYLRDVITDSTNEMLNDFLTKRQEDGFGKTLLDNKVLLNRYGFTRDQIVNQNRFVGFQIRLRTEEGLTMLLNQIGLQFTGNNTFTLYLYHSSKDAPITTLEVTTDSANGAWKWVNFDQVLKAFNDLQYTGGVFVLGYYQEDLGGSAINYTNFNWDKGECASCNSSYVSEWIQMGKYFGFYPLYVPQGKYTKGQMFDLNDALYTNNQSWGLNFRMSVRCDYTQFFVENKFAFKNLLGWKVVNKVLDMMKYSTETNNIQEDILSMIIRDLEGDKETNFVNIPTEYHRELKGVIYNTGGLNEFCFKCKESRYAPKYSAI